MVVVEMEVVLRNFETVQGKLHKFPKNIDKSLKETLQLYFDQDFKPMLSKVLKGFRAANVPGVNAPRYAAKKKSMWGISHSLGMMTGHLHAGAMNEKAHIRQYGNKTTMVAQYDSVPRGGYPYMVVVHEGLDGLHKQYPMVEGARLMTHKKLMSRLDSGLSQAWNRAS